MLFEFAIRMAYVSIMHVASEYNPKATPQVTNEKRTVKYVS